MSAIEQISILTASAKIHYIAIGVFTILFGIFYAIAYIDQFKDVRNKIEKWRISIFGSKKNEISNEEVYEETNEIDDTLENETNNVRETLSPF
jgi:archaellum component FlaF (FlaF/FlaG flagellin family)